MTVDKLNSEIAHLKQVIFKLKNEIKENENSFEKGFIAACAVTLKNHGCDTIVEDTLRCNFMSEVDMRKIGVEEFDIEILKPIIKEINRKRKINNQIK